jgi:hypothetical protein
VRDSAVKPSPVVSINGYNVTSFLLHEQGGNQNGKEMIQRDPDSEYNTMFYSLRSIVSGSSNGLGYFATPGIVTSPMFNYVLSFQNGTVSNISNFATPSISFKNISSGPDLFAAVYSEQLVGTDQGVDAGAFDLSVYPEPVIQHSGGIVAGYFLNTTGYTDTAVLALLSFLPATNQAGQEYQSVVQSFLAACLNAGKTKLVIDLSGNPGGEPNLATE